MGKTKQKQDRSHYLFSNRELANLIGPLVIEQLLAVFVGMVEQLLPDSILAGKMKNQHVKRLHSWYGL